MSRLEELIQQLCPDGVQFSPLWSVTIWDKKFNSVDKRKQPKVNKYSYLLATDLFALERKGGDVFLLSTGEQTGWTTEELAGTNLHKGEVVTIPWGKTRAVTDCIKYYKGKFVTADNRIMTSADTSILLNKYLYYWVMTQGEKIDTFYRGSGIKHPDMEKVLDLQIPIPPLPVQQEIVRILDSFTQLTAELTAELTARRKQYDFYSKALLTAKKSSKCFTLGQICLMKAGKAISSTEISKSPSNEYPYPCFGGNGLRGYVSAPNQEGNHSLIGRQGALCGNVCYASGEFYATEHAVVVTPKEGINSRYLYYLLQVSNLNQYKTAGAQPGLSVAKLDKVTVYIPPLSEQTRIVSILDRFDALCNDLTSGLPAEIEARRKQYEYYRDKLLNFEELRGE